MTAIITCQTLATGANYVNMADLISRPSARLSLAEQMARPSDDDLIRLVELFFFAYRDFTGEPDAILAAYGLGRAQHRALHFVVRHPGIRVTDLLAILKITKQSLARVLKPLVDDRWIDSRPGADDRRERLLFPTDRGRDLIRQLAGRQMERIANALAAAYPAGHDAAGSRGILTEEGLRRFLFAMIGEEDRGEVDALIEGAVKRTRSQETGPV